MIKETHEEIKGRTWLKGLLLAARPCLSGIFVYASIDKIFPPAAFAHPVYNYQILPDRLVNLAAIFLPWLELLLGSCLIAGVLLPGATMIANALLIAFTGALFFNLARGLDIDSGVFENPVDGPLPGVGGIMFDAAAGYGGAGQSPERQGCTVFRNHSWFKDLVAPPPADNNQAAALRKFLYTYVHEIGHVFNFLHSWDKGRPDALSWMNYDWKYDRLPGNRSSSFWANFEFRFDDEELIHLRHGNRAAVIPGGDPWASGLHAESSAGAMADLLGEAHIELLVRSKGYFQFMEPVLIEFRIRNTSDPSSSPPRLSRRR